MELDLSRLKEMHPLLAASTALEYSYRAAIGLNRHGHLSGSSLKISLDNEDQQGRLHWSKTRQEEDTQLDYIRVTEDTAEAITLALVNVVNGWVIRRRLQRGEFADWLLADRNNNTIALEVSGVDQSDVGKRRLQQKVKQVRQSSAARRKAACVVELRPLRSRLATAT
jgi:hypothetical protein